MVSSSSSSSSNSTEAAFRMRQLQFPAAAPNCVVDVMKGRGALIKQPKGDGCSVAVVLVVVVVVLIIE